MKIFLSADEKGDNDPELEGFIGTECFPFNYYEKERKLKEISPHRALIILLLLLLVWWKIYIDCKVAV